MEVDSSSHSEDESLDEEFIVDFCKETSKRFFEEHGLISHQINSYNDFIENGLQKLFDSLGEVTVMPSYVPSKKGDRDWHHVSVRFGRVKVDKPSFWTAKKSSDIEVDYSKTGKRDNEVTSDYLKLLPRHARLMNMTYSGRMKVEVSWQVYKPQLVHSDKSGMGKEKYVDRDVKSGNTKEVVIGRLPVMVNSNLCWMRGHRRDCYFDHGGYFVIKGAEKTFVAQEERCSNRLWVSESPCFGVTYPSTFKKKRIYIKLENPKSNGLNQQKAITVWFIYATFPIWILFFALGATSDREICEMIDVDITDPIVSDILLSTIHAADENCESFRKGSSALSYINKLVMETKFPPEESIESCIEKYLFPSLEGTRMKSFYLAYMVKCLLLSILGKRRCDSRDDYRNKRLDLASELLSRELWGHVRHMHRRMSRSMQKDLSGAGNIKSIECYIDASIITNGLVRAFSTGSWTHAYKRNEKCSGVVATLRRTNPLQMTADLRKSRQQVQYSGMTGDARYPNPSYWGKVCFISTPDGENCGLVKNLAATGLVSINSKEPHIKQLVECGMEKLDTECLFASNGKEKIFVNGIWVGVCKNSSSFVKKLREMRRRGLIGSQVEVKCDQPQGEVRIFSDAGRILRPLLVAENIKQVKSFGKGRYSFHSLIEKGIIELIGAEEEEDCYTCCEVKKLLVSKATMYTHCELDMSFLLALSCGIIPFANHNAARRILYESEKHSQQAIGFSTTNPDIRVDTTSHQLYYPQRPLFQTMLSECVGRPARGVGYNNKLPRPEFYNGQNAVVAVNVHLGYNQEDSLVMNQASIERGMFRTEHFRSYKSVVDNKEIYENRRLKLKDPVCFCKVESKFGQIDSLDEDGFPYIGANMQSGDIVIGKGAESGTDLSVKLKHTERGVVQKVVLSANDEGKNFAVVSLRQVRSPSLGDKFSSMHGQKGVVGFLESQENFPFTLQGIVPDIVINPHAFPTRQTPGQLLEAALGKGIACGGSIRYATPFTTPSVEVITEQLQRVGFSRWGAERVQNGRSGEMMPCLIFMGPTFYQRLNHMAEDKLKFRNTGPVHPLTRQPVSERKRFGGVKFGEMERDCLLAHGAAANLHERLFTLSDHSQMYICQKCERVASVILRPVSGGRKIRGPYCRFCESGETILKVNVPYGAKLLTQELFSMGISLKFKVEEC